ncbi:MAG: DNA polymerase III subunit beta [Halieaceae bacterium]|jgi:DNA polymerase-3 subunit beta|nr:DNA polymerase III subunit beta [Halieaceae bacterium]
MKFRVPREALLGPLNLVAGVVERRQTLPVLANVLLNLDGRHLSITGTDLEVELVGRLTLEQEGENGEVTVPARKLTDICRSLPEGADIELSVSNSRATLRSGRSRFTLSTLPAREFPNIEDSIGTHQFTLKQAELRRLIERTSFAMAQQDVRYYLNGMYMELRAGRLRTVATDGHRLAVCTYPNTMTDQEDTQVIVPRKGVLELARLMQADDGEVTVILGSNHLRATTPDFTFTSKLIDGKFPDYERVLPRAADKVLEADRLELRQAFTRTAILSNEKYRGVRLKLDQGGLEIEANNPEQEQAEETLPVNYSGEALEIGFNVGYLLDVLGVLSGDQIRFSLGDSNSSALLEEADGGDSLYVVMPMRL